MVTMKVAAMSLPVENELTLWLPDSAGHTHIIKIYNKGDGVTRIDAINTKVEVDQ